MEVKEAFETLKKAIQDDDGYAWGWHCNIAMPAMDEGLTHKAANRAAARFMYNCFNIDTTKFKEYKDIIERE